MYWTGGWLLRPRPDSENSIHSSYSSANPRTFWSLHQNRQKARENVEGPLPLLTVLVLGEQINTAAQMPRFRAQLFGSIYLHSSWQSTVVAQKAAGMRCAEELMAFHPLERPPWAHLTCEQWFPAWCRWGYQWGVPTDLLRSRQGKLTASFFGFLQIRDLIRQALWTRASRHCIIQERKKWRWVR